MKTGLIRNCMTQNSKFSRKASNSSWKAQIVRLRKHLRGEKAKPILPCKGGCTDLINLGDAVISIEQALPQWEIIRSKVSCFHLTILKERILHLVLNQ